MCAYHSPSRFAVSCVLLLLYMPRHPPYALIHLITGPLSWLRVVQSSFQSLIRTVQRSTSNIFFWFLKSYNFSERSCLSICFLLFGFQRTITVWEIFRSLKTKQAYFLTNPTSLSIFLLRKEVIHPHVPVGIPCYDLTPIISPTFDGSLLLRG